MRMQQKSIVAKLLLVMQPFEKAHFHGLCQYLEVMNNLEYDAL